MTEDGRTEDGKWKIEQCSVGPETAIIYAKVEMIYTYGCDCAQFKVPDAYEEGATSMDIVAKTRELKKRHRATLVMPDDLKSKVYRRRRRVKEDTEEIECEDGDGGDQDIGCLHELQLLETQLLAREATPAEQIAALTRLSTLEVNCSFFHF